jgi:hypothetical protein
MALGLTQPGVPGVFPGGKGDLGTLTSWNPLGHPRPVTGLLYILLISIMKVVGFI